MSIDNLINEFLLTEELSESSKPIYENVLLVFAGYYRENNCDICKLMHEDIFKSLDYYINERKIKFENTARFYISSVKEFIIHCISNTDISNTGLLSLFGYGNNNGGFDEMVNIKINSLINSKIIKREKTGVEISSEDFKKLINDCDTIIDNFTVEDLKTNVYNGKYMEYISALGLKILSYTGIKVGLLIDIKLDCLVVGDGYLKINNNKKNKLFKVQIPMKLYRQLIYYKDSIRNELLKIKNLQCDGAYLFLDFNLKPLKTVRKNEPINTLIFKLIGENKEMGSATARVSKRVIIDMISAGMNVKIIEDLTGYGGTVIQYCKEKVDEIKREKKDPNDYINKYILKRNNEYRYYNTF